jgi:hypothetical protein
MEPIHESKLLRTLNYSEPKEETLEHKLNALHSSLLNQEYKETSPIMQERKRLDEEYCKQAKELDFKVSAIHDKYFDKRIQGEKELFGDVDPSEALSLNADIPVLSTLAEPYTGTYSLRQYLFYHYFEEDGIFDSDIDSLTKEDITSILTEYGWDPEQLYQTLRDGFFNQFDDILGMVSDPNDPSGASVYAHELLMDKSHKTYSLTKDNIQFFDFILDSSAYLLNGELDDMEDAARKEERRTGSPRLKKAELRRINLSRLDDFCMRCIRDGLYSLAENPHMQFTCTVVEECLDHRFGLSSREMLDALDSLSATVKMFSSYSALEPQNKEFFDAATELIEKCSQDITLLSRSLAVPR